MIVRPSRAKSARCARAALAVCVAVSILQSAAFGVDITVGSGGLLTIGARTGPTLTGFTGFTQNGSAVIDGGQTSVALTPNLNGQVGTVWTTASQTISNANGFGASFIYTAGGDRLADGATFTIQNAAAGATAIGAGGGGLGYESILNSGSYQINIFDDVGTVVNANGATGHNGGEIYHSTLPGVDFASGHPIEVMLNYDNGWMVESLHDTISGGVYSHGYLIDLEAALGGTSGRIGFTGAMGGASASQTISGFTFLFGPGNNQVVNADHLTVNNGGRVVGTSGSINAPIWTINGGAVSISGSAVSFNTFTQTGGTVAMDALSIASGNIYDIQGGENTLAGITILSGGSVSLSGGRFNVGSLSNAGIFNWTSGELHITGPSGLVLDNTSVGTNRIISEDMGLFVSKTTNVPSGSVLTLDGGTFSTGSLTSSGIINLRSGNFFLKNQNLDIDPTGPLGKSLLIGPDLHVTVKLITNLSDEGVLAVIGGTYTSEAVINEGTITVVDADFSVGSHSESDFGFDAIRSFVTFGSGESDRMISRGTMNLIDTNVYGDLLLTSGSILRTNGVVVFLGNVESEAPLALNGNVEFVGPGTSLLAVGGTANILVHDTANVISDAITLPSLAIDGHVTLRAGASASKLSSLSIAHSGSTFTGGIDLKENQLILQSTDAPDKTAKLSFLKSAVVSGHNGGDWLGNGITSANAAADTTHFAVGTFDNAVLGLTLLGGQTVNSSSIIISVAHLGDANFDGTVNNADLAVVSGNWLQSRNTWTAGNFTDDGTTDSADLAPLATNWQDAQPYPLAVVGYANIANTLGTVFLLTDSVYAGASTIAGGTLQIGNGGTIGSLGTGAIINNSNLRFNRNDTVTIPAPISGTGTAEQAGTGATILTGLYSATGAMTVSNGNLAFGDTAAPRQTVAVLVKASSLTVTAGKTLDMGNRDLLIKSGSSAAFEAQVGAAYNFGLFDLPGISSSTAGASGGLTTLGVNSGDDYNNFGTSPGLFDGSAVVSGDTVIKYTYTGDLNLDGVVDDNDLFQFLGTYLGSQVGNYAFGDVNFDTVVDDNDLFPFLGAYLNPPSPQLGGLDDVPPPTAVESTTTPVPEPATLFLLGLGSAGLLLCRRKCPMGNRVVCWW